MFEKLSECKERGVYIVFPASFESSELLDIMAPSFVVGVGNGNYIVTFDPRSVMTSGSFEESGGCKNVVLELFQDALGQGLKVSFREDEEAVERIREDVRFYQEMGVVIVEENGKEIKTENFEKIKDRFKMFSMIAEKARQIRYSVEPGMLSVSPGMAGLSLFLTLDTKFMIWLKNETGLEGEKFKYALIRIFNVVVSRLSRHFKYEKMFILPYESLVVLTRDVERLGRFLKAVDLVNNGLRSYLLENFGEMIAKVKGMSGSEIADIFKSKESFYDILAAMPDRKGFEHFKEKLVGAVESFNSQLQPIGEAVDKWLEKLLEEVPR